MSRLRHRVQSVLNSLWYGGSALAFLLWPAAFAFRALVALRRLAYRGGWLPSHDVGVPVIVVGNLTVGGTGKTPATIWLARRVSERGLNVGIVWRGYGGRSREWPRLVDESSDAAVVGDEARLLAGRSGCPVAVGPDRVAAARLLVRSRSLDLILADDGLQHYRLRRAFEIVVIDGTRGFGNGLCLPAGPLREPPSRLAEADAVIVNGGDFSRARAYHADVSVIRVHELATGAEKSLSEFRGQPVHAVAAIGNPERFFNLLSAHGLDVEPHPKPDHAPLDADELAFADGKPVLITEKDAVKCESSNVPNLWCVVIDLEFAPGDGERLESEILRLLKGKPENQ